MSDTRVRQRLTREDRYTQLVEVAWQIIRDEGTEALTLGHLAECAGVTKPVVYDHFISRSGLLAALYREYDQRQNQKMDEVISRTDATPEKLAAVIATAYIDCVLLQGREMPSVLAALAGTPELEKIRREYAVDFIGKCRTLFAPFCTHPLRDAALWAMLGSAEGLAWAVVQGAITDVQAKDELCAVIIGMVHTA
ncbi:transcriptional regulator, TetR family [Kosakonia oryzendophytica]|uniref:Transcriptional regulator, TetR family n=1 Tax=Kosakonia oryzendophytica TaxID=1005665 RepID=A0A1C4CL16_9ENTR|nr:TetR/AcrR family transcriptional regulator [Kosakonia oryzendophytica]AMO47446.1 TetR family transcriptional regulator [Enterobacter sp. FY-07]TDT57031.1 TetR family transcriptional regulator [Enterobacter sp. AG5470]WBT59166.1 TetR/AcrR family transcriptional regulator [Kosakonia oryzendophytica]SCC19811.1 transcriptional regulator, TetR family [Kosakonia oryzendophytica]